MFAYSVSDTASAINPNRNMKPAVRTVNEHEPSLAMPVIHQGARSDLPTQPGYEGRDSRECVVRLQRWIDDLIQSGDAQKADIDPNILRIGKRASSSFCVGTRDSRWFIGVAATDLTWFLGLPWFHVAIKRGSAHLNLVCEQLVLDSLHLPAFCISLHSSKPGSFDELSHHKLIDVREASALGGGRFNSFGSAILRTIDVRVTNDESTMNGLLAGKFMTGHSNRSVFRSIKK